MKRLFIFMFSLPWSPFFIMLSIILFWIVTYVIVDFVRPEREIAPKETVEVIPQPIPIEVKTPERKSPF